MAQCALWHAPATRHSPARTHPAVKVGDYPVADALDLVLAARVVQVAHARPGRLPRIQAPASQCQLQHMTARARSAACTHLLTFPIFHPKSSL